MPLQIWSIGGIRGTDIKIGEKNHETISNQYTKCQDFIPYSSSGCHRHPSKKKTKKRCIRKCRNVDAYAAFLFGPQ